MLVHVLLYKEKYWILYYRKETWNSWLHPVESLENYLVLLYTSKRFIFPYTIRFMYCFALRITDTRIYILTPNCHCVLIFCTDQFIACGRTGEKAHELASNIWIAVIDNLEENQQTFMLLKHLAQEGDVRTVSEYIFLILGAEKRNILTFHVPVE